MKNSDKWQRAWVKTKGGFGYAGYAIATFCQSHWDWIVMGVVLAVGLVTRYYLSFFASRDLYIYVFRWMATLSPESQPFGGHGFSYFATAAFSAQGGNIPAVDQPPFYILIQAIIAQIPYGHMEAGFGQGAVYQYQYNWMLGIKSVNYAFDLASAIGIYLIVRRVTQNDPIRSALAFCVAFLLPIQIANSAIWGQNDTYYTTFGVWMLYFLLSKKPGWACVFAGLAMAAKAQGIFFAPFLLFAWVNRRIKFRHLWLIPLVILLTYSPYWLAGGDFVSPFRWLGHGFGSYGQMDYASGNFYSFFSFQYNDSTFWATSRIMTNGAYGLLVGCLASLLTAMHLRKVKLTDQAWILALLILSMSTTYFMPKMHERYFFATEVFALIYALTANKRYWAVAAKQVSAAFCYAPYLFAKPIFPILDNSGSWDNGNRINYAIGGVINTVLLITFIYDWFRLPTKSKAEQDQEMASLAEGKAKALAAMKGQAEKTPDRPTQAK